MSAEFSDADLEAYLDEALDPKRAMQLEQRVREDDELLARLSHINGRRDAGIHTLGEIWRRNQIGVPSIEQMSNYLLGVCSADEADYIEFRMEQLKCPYTVAMYTDLKAQNEGAEDPAGTEDRRRQLGNKARQTVMEEFNLEAMARHAVALYGEAISTDFKIEIIGVMPLPAAKRK